MLFTCGILMCCSDFNPEMLEKALRLMLKALGREADWSCLLYSKALASIIRALGACSAVHVLCPCIVDFVIVSSVMISGGLDFIVLVSICLFSC